ncbi:MAG TPA: hypothetical protein VIX84_06590 [Acidimicrobiales bacterium]
MRATGTRASSGRGRDVATITIGVGALVGALVMGVWVVHANAIASATRPSATVSWSGPDGTAGEPVDASPPRVPHPPDKGRGHHHHHHHVPGGGGSGVGQAFALAVQPAPLHVSPTSESVGLTRWRGRGDGDGGPFVGELSPITVVATGSLAGWHASVTLVALSNDAQLKGAHFCVSPDNPTLVDGNAGDVVRADHRSCGTVGDTLPVFFAAPGGGGGTYSDAAHLTLFVRGGIDASEVTATLKVSVS